MAKTNMNVEVLSEVLSNNKDKVSYSMNDSSKLREFAQSTTPEEETVSIMLNDRMAYIEKSFKAIDQENNERKYIDFSRILKELERINNDSAYMFDVVKNLLEEDYEEEEEEEEVSSSDSVQIDTTPFIDLFSNGKRKPVKVLSKTKQKEFVNSSVNWNKHYSEYSSDMTQEELQALCFGGVEYENEEEEEEILTEKLLTIIKNREQDAKDYRESIKHLMETIQEITERNKDLCEIANSRFKLIEELQKENDKLKEQHLFDLIYAEKLQREFEKVCSELLDLKTDMLKNMSVPEEEYYLLHN